MNNTTYLNFLWKMAFVEDGQCGRCPVEGGRGRWCLLVRGDRGNATHQMLLDPKLTANDLTTAKISIIEFTNQKPLQILDQDNSNSLVNTVWNITYKLCDITKMNLK